MAYTPELDAELFKLVSTGLSLTKISKLDGMPGLSPMLTWIADEAHPFHKTYLRAKSILIPLYEEQALDAALDALSHDVVTHRTGGKDGDVTEVRTVDNVERSKLIVSTTQWCLGWMMPKKHGRLANPDADKPTAQLEALFQSLKSGPAE